MKKIYKYVFLILLIFMFSNNLEAKVYNYSCDYSFVAPGTGETIKFRIRVYDLDEAYIKGKEASYWENDSFWKEHVAFMPFKDGKYKPFEYTWANSGETKDFDGRNSKGCNSLWTLSPFGQMPDFVERSVDLQKNDIVCPSYRVYRVNDSYPSYCVINSLNEDPHEIVDTDPNSGSEIGRHSYSNPYVTTVGLNCYDDDGNPKKCESVAGKTGIYDKENLVECFYTGNNGIPYKLVYNKKDKTLEFDENNAGYTLDSSVPHEEKEGKIFLTDSALISKFESVAADNKCPSKISCDCGWKIELGFNSHWGEYRGTTCYFNSTDKVNDKCGKLTSENGEFVDPSKSNGKKPDTPNLGFNTNPMTCTEILGPNLTKIVHAGIKAIQIIGAIAAIVKGMITLIPAVMAKDAEGLKKAQKTLVTMAIILLCIFLLPYLVRWIGNILGYDISCLV